MTAPEFRHPEKFQQLPSRDWIRKNMPSGDAGFVAEDLDLILRVYGNSFHTDNTGKFMLVEQKFGNSWIQHAQRMTFGLLDRLLRQADPEGARYAGFFILQFSDDDWDKAEFKINRQPVTREELLSFFAFDNGILGRLPSVSWQEVTSGISTHEN